ncbi:FmdB family zinc ribbon protein [Pseudochelatococcus sp. B33]
MPYYEYECGRCGVFTALRPMARYAEPHDCPECGAEAPRVLYTAPAMATMASSRRMAYAVNERSRHEPRLASSGHGAGCACCSPGKLGKGRVATSANGVKSFPTARPWMISH